MISAHPTSLRKNTFFSFLSSSLRLVTNFLFFVGIARVFGAEEFGTLTAHTLATLLIVLADFGIDTLLATEIAKNRVNADRIVRGYLFPKLVFALVASLILFFAPMVLTVSAGTEILMRVLCAFVFSSALMNFFLGLFKGLELLHLETIVSTVANGFLIGSLPFLWFMKRKHNRCINRFCHISNAGAWIVGILCSEVA